MSEPEKNEPDEAAALHIEGAIGRITFSRPHALNALNLAMARGFLSAVQTAIARDARVLIFSGAGRAFMAGGDLAYLARAEDRGAAALTLIEPINEALRLLAASSILTIAELRGPVAGAGMSLALAADFAVADESVLFSSAYIKVAATPDCGGSWRLTQLLGVRRALEVALLAEQIDAERALRLGLVNQVVSSDLLRQTCVDLAERLAKLPHEAATQTRALILGAATTAFSDQLDKEATAFAAIARTDEFGARAAAFLAKQKK